MKPLLILDRDVVVVDTADTPVRVPDDLVPIPGSLEAIARANHLGYRVVVLNKRSGATQGEFDVGQMNSIHHRLMQRVSAVGGCIDAFFVCPEAAEDAADGDTSNAADVVKMLTERLRIAPNQAVVVGDRPGDLETARRFGARVILVRSGTSGAGGDAANDNALDQVPVFNNLAEAVEQVLVRQQA